MVGGRVLIASTDAGISASNKSWNLRENDQHRCSRFFCYRILRFRPSDEEITARGILPSWRDVRGKKMSNIEERVAKVRELESVASNPTNDAITRKIASDRIINLRLLIQNQQGSSRTGRKKAVQRGP